MKEQEQDYALHVAEQAIHSMSMFYTLAADPTDIDDEYVKQLAEQIVIAAKATVEFTKARLQDAHEHKFT